MLDSSNTKTSPSFSGDLKLLRSTSVFSQILPRCPHPMCSLFDLPSPAVQPNLIARRQSYRRCVEGGQGSASSALALHLGPEPVVCRPDEFTVRMLNSQSSHWLVM